MQNIIETTTAPTFSADTALPVFYRTYSRWNGTEQENWDAVCDRTLAGIARLGKLTIAEASLVSRMQRNLKALPSGRWLWLGGTDWIERPENFPGAYNCTSTEVTDLRAFGLLMDLGMMGCGTGAVIEDHCIQQLPPIRNQLKVAVIGQPGGVSIGAIPENSTLENWSNESHYSFTLHVGDSRQGWVKAYEWLLYLATAETFPDFITETLLSHRVVGTPIPPKSILHIQINLNFVRPAGSRLRGFGGTANPIKLPDLFPRIVQILNRAIGRRLNGEEVCLLIDEAALAIVAGNIRRFAGIKQVSAHTPSLKTDLWRQVGDEWQIDPERDALRMSNHTRVFHHKPSLEECVDAVRSQYKSGEGAIQWAGETLVRTNADLLNTPDKKQEFLRCYNDSPATAGAYLLKVYREQNELELTDEELKDRLRRLGLNPCGEIPMHNNFCNLAEVHLGQIDPTDFVEQEEAFTAAALQVSSLLHHRFTEPRYQRSRELDPIVGVSFTGLFDFFVHAFGVDWLRWWAAGRPKQWGKPVYDDNDMLQSEYFASREQHYLEFWKGIVQRVVWEYCERHGLTCPNRYTTVQPAGTKSLLTGASPGWHPPKAQRFIRRITFAKNDPVARACIDYGYSVVPGQADKDEHGKLLVDPFDERCTEWLVEIPVEVSWANLEGVEQIDISQFSGLAQFDFWMQVQRHYTTHNTSATIEIREAEIDTIGYRIYQAIHEDEGYISTTLLARFDEQETFPRLPYEPISAETYRALIQDIQARRTVHDFHEALKRHHTGQMSEAGPAGCDSDRCLLPILPA